MSTYTAYCLVAGELKDRSAQMSAAGVGQRVLRWR